jgi:hypothetical protein
MRKVVSSNIDSVGFNEADNRLTVRYKNGSTYEYGDVSPDEFNSLIKSKSIGRHVNEFIKPIKSGIMVNAQDVKKPGIVGRLNVQV